MLLFNDLTAHIGNPMDLVECFDDRDLLREDAWIDEPLNTIGENTTTTTTTKRMDGIFYLQRLQRRQVFDDAAVAFRISAVHVA
jgi:hypothetical protein